ncbi:hypothetical protein N7488_003896 [Penicillium malachiteum]|nr:hypothetical protein N7488_003896 [Penicillium malachiteum]
MSSDPTLAITDALSFLSLRPPQLAPPPQSPPSCRECGRRSTRRITQQSNKKGNAGRPFYKCLRCDKFLCFDDRRGNDVSNPLCYCGASSKEQRAGPDKRVPGGLHFVCRLGCCDFYQAHRNSRGQDLIIPDDLVEDMKKISFV